MFSLSSKVEIDDRSYEIRTDFRVILEIFVMLDDLRQAEADARDKRIEKYVKKYQKKEKPGSI